jgi:hypothetical protein
MLDLAADSFLYNFGGCTLHKIKTKALIQFICPGDFRVAWPFIWTGDLFFVYINVLKKHHIQESTVPTPFL